MTIELGSRSFTLAQQMDFVRLSGDANPIHADAVEAAQMFPGGIIVHGMNSLSWALELAFARDGALALRALRATFLKPILLDQVVTATLAPRNEGLRLTLTLAGMTVTTADLALGAAPIFAAPPALNGPERTSPVKRPLNTLEGLRGEMAMTPAAGGLLAQFPNLVTHLGPARVVGLAALATLVGMECPGLYGVSTDVGVTFDASPGPLRYAVTRVDARFSRATMAVEGYGFSGSVTAFVNAPK